MATLNPTFRQLDMTLQLNRVEKKKSKQTCKIIDIFAGMGGMRLGFEQAFKKYGVETECVMTSEIKASAIDALNCNF